VSFITDRAVIAFRLVEVMFKVIFEIMLKEFFIGCVLLAFR